MSSMASAAKKIYSAAIDAVSPYTLIKNSVKFNPATKTLSISGNSFPVNKNVKVVAFGKAVLGMVAALERILGNHIVEGVASVPIGAVETAKRIFHHYDILSPHIKTRIYEGAANNLPDAQAASAAQHILKLVSEASCDDIVLVLMSGGGSALLPCPVDGVSLQEKRQAVELLSKTGANIQELNTLRKSLSLVKGGKLAEAAFPAKVVTLILSDVVGDPLPVIASGPTLPHRTQHEDVLKLFHTYKLEEKVPKSILKYLRQSSQCTTTTTTTSEKTGGREIVIDNGEYQHVQNVIIGSNKLATTAAACVAEELGYQTLVWSHHIQGEARLIGAAYAKLVHSILNVEKLSTDALVSLFDEQPFSDLFKSYPNLQHDFAHLVANFAALDCRPLCLISAGEPTVTVKGQGRGGRNQELALAFGLEMRKLSESDQSTTAYTSSTQECHKWLFFSVGTDGQDGPCDAAGAMVDETTLSAALEQTLNPHAYLAENDSYNFFSNLSQGANIIKTGLTGTNVMDLHVFLLQ